MKEQGMVGVIPCSTIRNTMKKLKTKKDVIDKIIDNIINNDSSIVHIANEKKSLYEHYISKGLNPEPIEIPKEMENLIPKDTSLINNSI